MSTQLGKEEGLPEQPDDGADENAQTPRGLLQKIRGRVQEAIEAGREAAREKEDALRREFERSIHPEP